VSGIRHIVMWRLNGATPDAKRAQAQAIKAALEALNGQIPGLRHLEVGIDFSAEGDSADVVMVSDFDSRAALDAYQSHPLHKQAGAVVKAARCERRVVDYET
jgi:hypothetical protein